MDSFRRALLALLLLPVALPAADAPAKDWKDHAGKLEFIVGYAQGLDEAKFSGRPMMAFFTTTW